MSDYSDEVAPRNRGMTPIRVTLAAGVPQRFFISGDWIASITEPGGVSDLTARFDDSEQVPLPAGLGFRRYYKTLEFQSTLGGSFVILAGYGSVQDGRSNANVTVSANLVSGNVFDNGGDVVCLTAANTQLAILDPFRQYLVVTNPITSTGAVRLGNVGVASNSGMVLDIGETLTIGTTAAVYASNQSGVTVTLAVASIRQT